MWSLVLISKTLPKSKVNELFLGDTRIFLDRVLKKQCNYYQAMAFSITLNFVDSNCFFVQFDSMF